MSEDHEDSHGQYFVLNFFSPFTLPSHFFPCPSSVRTTDSTSRDLFHHMKASFTVVKNVSFINANRYCSRKCNNFSYCTCLKINLSLFFTSFLFTVAFFKTLSTSNSDAMIIRLGDNHILLGSTFS
jgi:hypothetical protein